MSPEQLAVWQQVALFVEQHPNGVGRRDVAMHFGVLKETATQHLEKCVDRGACHKVYTWVRRNSRGWVYYAGPAQEPDDPAQLPF